MVSGPPPFGVPVPGNDWGGLAGVEPPPPRAVSVVVIHHEQERELARTLAALRTQTHPADRLEVIVVDDGSRTPPRAGPGVRLIRLGAGGGRRSAARNRGVAESRGEILVFLDADTTPEPGFVSRLTRLPSLAPEAVVVGARRHADLADVPLEADIVTAGPARELPAPAWLRDGYRATADLRDAGPDAFRYVISAVLGCTRWFFDEVGGFDESFAEYGGEDWEWAHRAWGAGAVLAHIPEAVAWHDGPDWSARSDAAARRAQKNRESIRLAERIGAPPLRARGLLTGRPELTVGLTGAPSPAAAFICVDSLLAALPCARVQVPGPWTAIFGGDPRVVAAGSPGEPDAPLHLELPAPVRFERGGLADLCAELLSIDAGITWLLDECGPVGRIVSRRHRRRVDRWGAAGGSPEVERRVDWMHRLVPAHGSPDEPDEPDVEAYLGGWERGAN